MTNRTKCGVTEQKVMTRNKNNETETKSNEMETKSDKAETKSVKIEQNIYLGKFKNIVT